MSAPRVRAAVEADLDTLVRIAGEAATEGGAHGRDRRHFAEELGRAFSGLVVVDDAAAVAAPPAEPLGYLLTWAVVDELHVLDIAIARAARRRGLARTLLAAAFDAARPRGAARVLLEVRAGNVPARTLYTSLGFTPFNVRERYYDDGEDAVELDLRL